MFKEILFNLIDQIEDYLNLKQVLTKTPLEKSIDFIINQINRDIDKIITLNNILK